jgi:hypothetical protein
MNNNTRDKCRKEFVIRNLRLIVIEQTKINVRKVHLTLQFPMQKKRKCTPKSKKLISKSHKTD